MPAAPRLGLFFTPDRPIGDLPGVARRVEALGLDELWLAEDCFLHGGIASVATALGATERITVGLGLLPAAVRNPAILAMEVATLAALHPGRVEVALGHGVEGWMRQIGARPPDRLTALEETTVALRALLHGREVTTRGRAVSLDAVALDRPPASPPPVHVGTTGPRGVALAGRVADGLLLPEGAGPAAVARAAGQLPAGATTRAYAWLRVEPETAAARRVLVPAVTAWRDSGLYPGLVAAAGVPEEGPIDEQAVARVAVAGDADACARGLLALAGAGASSVVLLPVGDDRDGQLEALARDVVPLLGAGHGSAREEDELD